MTGTHRPELDVNVFFKNGGTLQFSLPLSVKSRNIRDFRHDNLSRRTAFSRRTVTLEPNAMYFSPKGLTLSYSRRFIPAPLTSMIDVRDDSNPLYIHEGNTDLKDTWEDNLSISYRLSDARHRQMLYAQGHLWMQTNSVGLARSYNTGSGVTVVTPENMNGNWGGDASLEYEGAVGRRKRVQLGSDTHCAYTHNVDFLDEIPEKNVGFTRSTVNSTWLTETLKADYRKGSLHVGVRFSATWHHAASSRPGFSDINATDMAGGTVLSAPLFWGVSCSTDIMLRIHRGYRLPAMNTDNVIWNASLSRAFLPGKSLVVKVSAYDILAGQNVLSYAVNAQGHTETWTNSLRRYVMLHISYRLNIKPKKHQQNSI